jgi:hypothetical protein
MLPVRKYLKLERAGSDQQGQWAAPLLFDESFRPKSAYDALAAALRTQQAFQSPIGYSVTRSQV